MSERYERIVVEGIWLYDNTAPMAVYVVEMNYDYWYEMVLSEDLLEEGEKPELNADGVQFYVSFTRIGNVHNGFNTIDEAMRWAESMLPNPVKWGPIGG